VWAGGIGRWPTFEALANFVKTVVYVCGWIARHYIKRSSGFKIECPSLSIQVKYTLPSEKNIPLSYSYVLL